MRIRKTVFFLFKIFKICENFEFGFGFWHHRARNSMIVWILFVPRLLINSFILFYMIVSTFVRVNASSCTPEVAFVAIHGTRQLGLIAIFTVASCIYMGGYFFHVLMSGFAFLRRSFSQNDRWLKDGRGADNSCDWVVGIFDEKSLAFENFAL